MPTRIVIAPDDIYDTYVDFNDDLELDTDIYKMLLEKQVVKILILFAVWNFKSCIPFERLLDNNDVCYTKKIYF